MPAKGTRCAPGCGCGLHRPLTTEERFWRKVDKGGECWLWKGCTYPSGYGVLNVGGVMVPAHRLAWELAHGAIPDGLLACHRCDVRLCVRFDHLFLGTAADNTADMVRKGRGRYVAHRGEVNGRARLTSAAVRRIRERLAQGERPANLAREHGVGWTAIADIRDGKLWRYPEAGWKEAA